MEKFKLPLLLLTALFFVKNVTRGHKYREKKGYGIFIYDTKSVCAQKSKGKHFHFCSKIIPISGKSANSSMHKIAECEVLLLRYSPSCMIHLNKNLATICEFTVLLIYKNTFIHISFLENQFHLKNDHISFKNQEII